MKKRWCILKRMAYERVSRIKWVLIYIVSMLFGGVVVFGLSFYLNYKLLPAAKNSSRRENVAVKFDMPSPTQQIPPGELAVISSALTCKPDEVFSSMQKALLSYSRVCSLSINTKRASTIVTNIHKFPSLQSLTITGRVLDTVPPEFSQLKSLVLLNVSGNRITNVFIESSQLPNLRLLILQDNPISVSEQGRIRQAFPNTTVIF